MISGDIQRICVIGAGTMGSQIAQQCALHGYDVRLTDEDPAQLDAARRSNSKHLARRVEKARMTREEAEQAGDRVRTTVDRNEALDGAGFVIEAVVERLDIKRALFAELDRTADPSAILATNSSTIGISQIAADLPHAERCINMHFFHPVLVMKLVEVMRGPQTSDRAVDLTMELSRRIGKDPVLINREVYGLLVNRILGAIKREAFWLAEEGYASPQDIDRAVKLGLNHPMGPFELSDFSGLDVFYYAALQRFQETGDEQHRPPRILQKKVEAGELGRKTGKGFYEYPAEGGVD